MVYILNVVWEKLALMYTTDKKIIFKLFILPAAAIITSAQNIYVGLMADLNYSLLDCHLPLVSLQVMPCTLIASLYVLWSEVFQYSCVTKAQA